MDHAGASPVVCQFEQAHLDTTQLVIWASLDNLVRSDGNRSLARLAEGWSDLYSDATLPAAIVAKCCVVRGVFSAAIPRPSVCRNRHAVVRYPGDIGRILESSPTRGLVALAIFDLG